MSFRVEEFEARAREAEKRLAELESQIKYLKDKIDPKENVENEKFVLYYWGLKNRGNAIRLLFEERNVPYEYIHEPEAVKAVAACDGKDKTDVFAPPILKYRYSYLSQTSAIIQFVATKLNLRPKSDFDNARADMLVGNGFDITTELHNHRADDKQKLLSFLNGRFQIWLTTIEKPLLKLDKNKPLFYFEDRITHADLAIFNTLDAVREGLSEKYFKEFVADKHPTLNQHFEQIGSRPNIKKFIETQNNQGVRWFPAEHKMDNIPKVLSTN